MQNIQEVRQYILNDSTNDIDGSFKMSESLLNRVFKSTISRRGETFKGISNYELILLVKLSQICSSRGYIENFRLLDIKDITGCKRRNCYYILEGLKKKGFIDYTKGSWAGRYHINILENDFSNANYKKIHYLNMNKPFFTGMDSYFYSFCALSLNAKKLFLMISMNYRDEYGYTLSFKRAAERLQVDERHIKGYIEEINHVLPLNTLKIEDFISRSGKTRLLSMEKECIFMRSEREIAPDVVNFFKFKIMTKFEELGIFPGASLNDRLDKGRKDLSLATRLYNLCAEFMKKGYTMDTIYNAIIRHCKIDGIVQLYTFSHIREELNSLSVVT